MMFHNFYFLNFHFFQFHSVAIEKLQIQNKHTKQKTNMTITKVLFFSINTIKVNGHHSHFSIPIRVIWLPFCHTKHALTELLTGNFQTVIYLFSKKSIFSYILLKLLNQECTCLKKKKKTWDIILVEVFTKTITIFTVDPFQWHTELSSSSGLSWS